MSKVSFRRMRKRIAARGRRWCNPVLARSLAKLSDDEIDRALGRARLCRRDLFTARNAIARHRVRMANMLAMLEVDVADAVEEHWDAMKDADHRCSVCPSAGRCRRWIEWCQFNGAPRVFCPNSGIFAHIGAEQAKRHIGRYIG